MTIIVFGKNKVDWFPCKVWGTTLIRRSSHLFWYRTKRSFILPKRTVWDNMENTRKHLTGVFWGNKSSLVPQVCGKVPTHFMMTSRSEWEMILMVVTFGHFQEGVKTSAFLTNASSRNRRYRKRVEMVAINDVVRIDAHAVASTDKNIATS